MYFKEAAADNTLHRVGLFLREQAQVRTVQPLFEANGFQVETARELRGGNGSFGELVPENVEAMEAVVFDLSRYDDSCKAAREAKERCPMNTEIIVVGRENSLEHYRTMREMGIAEYYAHPVPAEELVRAARRLVRKEGLASSESRLVAVHGMHGGCGSGLLAAGLSAFLSQSHGRSTVLVDADLSAATAGSWLGSDRPGSLAMLMAETGRMDRVLVDQALQTPLPKLALLDGYEGLTNGKQVAFESFSRVRALLGTEFRYQVWRGNGGSGPLATYALDAASVAVLVCGGTFPAIREARQVQEYLTARNPGARVLLVYNEPHPKPVVTREALEQVLGTAVNYAIPYQKKLGEHLLRGVPFTAGAHCLYPTLSSMSADILGMPPQKRSWWKRVLK